MFRTIDHDLIGVPGMFGQGVSHWHGVSRLLRTHWFHVTLSVENEGRTTECTVMVDHTHNLQELLVSQGPDLAVTEVMVVTPSWMNKTASWQMQRLIKLTVGDDRNGSDISLVEVEGGGMYNTSHQREFLVEELTNLRPIFLQGMIQQAEASEDLALRSGE
ncbi:hypothetical protein IFT69_26580 [Pseudomonas putida]|nr:hypothetical protein [Pseudomonas putida]